MIGPLLALFAAACFSLSNVLSRKGMNWASVFETTVWNVLASFAVVAVVALVTVIKQGWPALDTKGVALAVSAGLVSNLSAATAFYATAARLGAARASTFRVLAPLVSIALGIALFSESLTYSAILGLALVMAGLLVVTNDSTQQAAGSHAAATQAVSGAVVDSGPPVAVSPGFEPAWTQASVAGVPTARTRRGHRRGDRADTRRAARSDVRSGLLLGGLMALLFGVGDVVRKGAVSVSLEPLWASLISSGTALSVIVAYGLATGGLMPALRLDRRALPYFLTGGVLTAAAIFALFSSLERAPVSIVTPLNSTQALFAVGFGALLNGAVERISLSLVLGSAVVSAGLVLVLR